VKLARTKASHRVMTLCDTHSPQKRHGRQRQQRQAGLHATVTQVQAMSDSHHPQISALPRFSGHPLIPGSLRPGFRSQQICGPHRPLRPTGGGEHEERAEDLDGSRGVCDHLVAYHLAPATTDFISDENRVCCNNDLEQTLTLLHSEWSNTEIPYLARR